MSLSRQSTAPVLVTKLITNEKKYTQKNSSDHELTHAGIVRTSYTRAYDYAQPVPIMFSLSLRTISTSQMLSAR